MKFNHKSNTFHEAIGLTEEQVKQVYKNWKEILGFIEKKCEECINNEGFQRSELIEAIYKKMKNQNLIENALMFDIAINYFGWLASKESMANFFERMLHGPPPGDPREIA